MSLPDCSANAVAEGVNLMGDVGSWLPGVVGPAMSGVGSMLGAGAEGKLQGFQAKDRVFAPDLLRRGLGNVEHLGAILAERAAEPVGLPGAYVAPTPWYGGGGLAMPVGVIGQDPGLIRPSVLGRPGVRFGGPISPISGQLTQGQQEEWMFPGAPRGGLSPILDRSTRALEGGTDQSQRETDYWREQGSKTPSYERLRQPPTTQTVQPGGGYYELFNALKLLGVERDPMGNLHHGATHPTNWGSNSRYVPFTPTGPGGGGGGGGDGGGGNGDNGDNGNGNGNGCPTGYYKDELTGQCVPREHGLLKDFTDPAEQQAWWDNWQERLKLEHGEDANINQIMNQILFTDKSPGGGWEENAANYFTTAAYNDPLNRRGLARELTTFQDTPGSSQFGSGGPGFGYDPKQAFLQGGSGLIEGGWGLGGSSGSSSGPPGWRRGSSDNPTRDAMVDAFNPQSGSSMTFNAPTTYGTAPDVKRRRKKRAEDLSTRGTIPQRVEF